MEPNRDERVLVMCPVDFRDAGDQELKRRCGLPLDALTLIDYTIPAGTAYDMSLLELLRNRWQDFGLGE